MNPAMNQSELNASFVNNEAYIDTLVSDMREPESFGVETLREEAYATYGIDQAEAYANDAANQSRTDAYESAVAARQTEREIRERNERAAEHIGHAAQLIAGYYRVFELSPENK